MASIAAATRLFDTHREWALNVAGAALRRIGPQADGDELRQVAQVATWERALAFDPSRWQVVPLVTSRVTGRAEPFQLFAYPTVYGACLMSGYRGAAGRAKTRDGQPVAFSPLDAAGGSTSVGEQRSVDEAIDQQHRSSLIAAILNELPKRERYLVAEHYLGGVSLSAIADSLHTSPASVSRIHASALGLLRVAVARRGVQAGEWL